MSLFFTRMLGLRRLGTEQKNVRLGDVAETLLQFG